MDNVLRQVSNLAARAGLKVPQFKKSDKTAPAGLAYEQPLDIEITGDFDGFYKFLLDLEQLPRITRIPDFSVVRSDKVDGEMKTKLVLSVYYEGEQSEAAK
jgi:type IV pilus assembly protein PilO